MIFPQQTRGAFHPEEFSTIGAKLAKRTGAPVVPLAVDTRFWGKGSLLSDYGPIKRRIPVRFAFGEPRHVQANEKEVHQHYLDFIAERLTEWGAYDESDPGAGAS